MDSYEWLGGIDVAVTVCDEQGIVRYMNEKAAATFAGDGGRALIGSDLFACHPPPAQAKLRELLRSRQPNSYTIEKNGVKKLIHQIPWSRDGRFAGLVEISLPIPFSMPHFVRDKAEKKKT